MHSGKIIRLLRKEKGFKQNVFANMLNISATYVSLIERGNKKPSLGLSRKMADILEISHERFVLLFIRDMFPNDTEHDLLFISTEPIVKQILDYFSPPKTA